MSLIVCWTTLDSPEAAQLLAQGALDGRLAACAQIDGPVISIYRWEGELCTEREYRLWLKTPVERYPALADFVQAKHPYDVPQWIAVEADKVEENYLKWAEEACSFPSSPKSGTH